MKPPPRKAAAAAAQEERLKKLQEYLAARGKLKQSSGKPYLKDKTNTQNLVPSKSDSTAKCKKSIIPNKTKGEQKTEAKHSVSAGQVPQHRVSRAPISRKPQNVPSELLRKGPLCPLPSKASAENPTGKRSITTSSSKHGLCQVRKTKKLEPVTEPRTQAVLQTAKSFTYPNHPVESSQEKADEENLRSKVDLSHEKKVAARFGLPSGSQTVNSRPNVGCATQGRTPVKRQARTYQAAQLQVQRNARGPLTNLKGADLQKQVPGVSGVQNALKGSQSSTSLRPEIKRRGLNPRATKQCTGVLGRGKENTAQSRMCRAPDALEGGQLKQQQATPFKAQHVRRHPRNSHASVNPSVTELRGKRTLPLAAHDDINKCGSATRKNQNCKKLQRAPSTPGLRLRPVISPDCTAKRVLGTLTRERSKSGLLGMTAGQEPKTPCTQDRRKLLEQWRKSQGKSYRRPPMTLPAAKPRKKKESLNQSFWSSLGEEERMECSFRDKISNMLMECLKFAEEGYHSEEILAMLSQIPEAEKFADFWICKAKLLARHGTFDVVTLYEAAVRAGAVPLQKLKEVVVDLLKNPDKTAQVVPTQVSPPPARDQVQMTPQSTLRCQTCKPVSGIKLQVVPLLRGKEHHAGPDTKLLTPVRRSLRIEGASACYPEMLKDHDPVVTSLNELVAADHGSLFVFRKNEALLEEVEVEVGLLRL